MGRDLALFSATDANMDTRPVLAATTTAADSTRAIDEFKVFRRSRLPFSRLSRTETVGSIPNRAKPAGQPVSFLAAGRRNPKDREPAGHERMVDLAPDRQATAALAPAKGFLATGT